MKQGNDMQLSEEAIRIHRDALVVDGHNDLPDKIRDRGYYSLEGFSLEDPPCGFQTDIPRLREGGVDAQVWVAFVPPELMHSGEAARVCLEQIDLIHRLVEKHGDHLELALTAGDVERIARSGRIASLIGVEGGHAIEDSLERLGEFHSLGARYMTLTHNETTSWADSSYDEARNGGLAPFGREVVREMNRLGMLVDVSHASDRTVWDALDAGRAPVIASHSSARSLCGARRNLPDELIRAIGASGGLVMVNLYPVFLVPEGVSVESAFFEKSMELRSMDLPPDEFKKAMDAFEQERTRLPRCKVDAVADHLEHIIRVAGIDHAGLGSDFDGIPFGPEQVPDVSGFPHITRALLDRGYGEKEIRKVLGENFLRVLGEAESHT
jgi:membrane dipeptidase